MEKTDLWRHQRIAYLKKINQKEKNRKNSNFDSQYLLTYISNKLETS